MLVGLDVTHPAPGSSKEAPSVSSNIASINARLGQWPADVRIQDWIQRNDRTFEKNVQVTAPVMAEAQPAIAT